MARDTGPKCKKCRREAEKLFLRGDRCFSPKCAIIKKKYPPGMHGAKKQMKRLSGYGLQLREKQKAKRIYGVLEQQFHNYYKKAVKKTGNSSFYMLSMLELRLDNAVYRAGFASSRNAARQLVGHGHILVNGKKVDIPSYQIKVGDVVKVKKTSPQYKNIREKLSASAQKREASGWMAVDPQELEFKIVSSPAAEDLPQNINSKLIIEYYSK